MCLVSIYKYHGFTRIRMYAGKQAGREEGREVGRWAYVFVCMVVRRSTAIMSGAVSWKQHGLHMTQRSIPK